MSEAMTLPMLLRSLHLPSMVREHEALSKTAERSSWSFTRYLHALVELEISDRAQRRVERNLKRSNLPGDKTLATLDQQRFPVKVRRQLGQLLEGDFIRQTENLLAFGLPGRGKTHLLCAIARELIINKGISVYFTRTFKLVQRLLLAKRELALENLLNKLDKFDVVLLDDIGYVQQAQEEMEVLFMFLSERYERRSLMITSNLVFSEWDKIFKNPMTTAAAIDRLVHHATILELTGDSYRMETSRAKEKPQVKKDLKKQEDDK